MKTKELYDELSAIAKAGGVTIRRESGRFKSGYCLIEEKPIIILNKIASPEYQNRVLALGITYFKIDDIFIKPKVREFIEKETHNNKINLFELNIEHSDNPPDK